VTPRRRSANSHTQRARCTKPARSLPRPERIVFLRAPARENYPWPRTTRRESPERHHGWCVVVMARGFVVACRLPRVPGAACFHVIVWVVVVACQQMQVSPLRLLQTRRLQPRLSPAATKNTATGASLLCVWRLIACAVCVCWRVPLCVSTVPLVSGCLFFLFSSFPRPLPSDCFRACLGPCCLALHMPPSPHVHPPFCLRHLRQSP